MDFRELLNKIDAVNTEAKKEPERLAFADAIDHVKDIKFTPPLPSGIKFSSANNIKFRGQDINDPKVKLALFQDELKNSPARLLGEIGSRIKPTSDAQMDLSGHIASLGEKLASGSNSLAQLSEPEKKLAIEAIKAALRGMELERDPDQSEYKDDEDEMESIEGEVAEGDGKPTDDNGDFVGDGKPTDEEILALADRYKQYEGGNGDSLLGGYIQYMTNTGVPYDSIEEEEWNKWREANPDKEFTMDVLEQEPENFPISKKFRDDLFKMYKGMPDEDDVHRIEDVISKPKENAELDADEGNAYAHKVRQAKMNGKKKGDEIDGPDGEKIKLEKDEKTPLGEFILSYFDRETGQFPKGETAVLTMVEKDYGEEFIKPAKAFIAKVYEVTEEYRQPEVSPEFERMRELAGLR
jgi:hypothetical protein